MTYHAAALEDEDLAPTGASSCFTPYNIGISLPAEKKAFIPWDQNSMTSPDKWSLSYSFKIMGNKNIFELKPDSPS